jgi:hypothetical protein
MAFWTGVNGSAHDPKRESRFVVSIGALNKSSYVWYAKSFTKPVATIKSVAHRYLNHSFNYPGSVEWNEVTLEMVDPTSDLDAAGTLAALLAACGYEVPSTESGLVTISKRKSVVALGAIYVSHIDDQGVQIEKWTLNQPIITKIDWGSVKYDSDNLNTLKLSLKYDWATCELGAESTGGTSAVTAVAASDTTKFFKLSGST